jgi:hypothetical protein
VDFRLLIHPVYIQCGFHFPISTLYEFSALFLKKSRITNMPYQI